MQYWGEMGLIAGVAFVVCLVIWDKSLLSSLSLVSQGGWHVRISHQLHPSLSLLQCVNDEKRDLHAVARTACGGISV